MTQGPESILEYWDRMRLDPVYFCETLLPKSPHPKQARWLREAQASINVLVPGNRWGKSTVIAMRHIWHCMFKIGAVPTGKHTWMTMPYETISAAHSADQALIVFGEARRLLQHPAIRPFVVAFRETPFPHIKFYNGAVFHCRSAHDGGKYLDGHAYRYVSIDEAGYIDDLKGLMNGVIIMRLAGGGMIDLIGTPKGYNHLYWYAQRGLRGVEGYYAMRGSIFDNPHLPEEDIKKRDMLLQHSDPRVRDQVIFGEFISTEGMAFTKDQLDNAFVPGMPAHEDYIGCTCGGGDGLGHTLLQECPTRHIYVQAWDLGRITDYTVGVTLDVTKRPWRLVDFQRLNKVPWEAIYELIGAKAEEFNVYAPIIDATGPLGDVIDQELTKRLRESGRAVMPYKMSTKVLKTDLINTLQDALDEGRPTVGQREWVDEALVVHTVPDLAPPSYVDPESQQWVDSGWGALRMPPITQLVDEMGVYQMDDKELVQDSVIALALAVKGVYEGVLHPAIGGSIYS